MKTDASEQKLALFIYRFHSKILTLIVGDRLFDTATYLIFNIVSGTKNATISTSS